MKKQVLTGLASLTLLDIAAAADLPRALPAKAPMLVGPAWTGPYMGLHGGYRWADAHFTSAAYDFFAGPGATTNPLSFPARSEGYHPNGGILGLHAGYNHLWTPNFLVGVEADWSWGWGKDSKTAAFPVNFGADAFAFRGVSEVELTWQASLRARLGIISGNWLFYGTGGVAFLHVKWADNATLTAVASSQIGAGNVAAATSSNNDKTLTGWTLGGGVEHMYSSNWLTRIEYLYADYGNFLVGHGLALQTGTLDIPRTHTLRAGVSYKFGVTPVVARY